MSLIKNESFVLYFLQSEVEPLSSTTSTDEVDSSIRQRSSTVNASTTTEASKRHNGGTIGGAGDSDGEGGIDSALSSEALFSRRDAISRHKSISYEREQKKRGMHGESGVEVVQSFWSRVWFLLNHKIFLMIALGYDSWVLVKWINSKLYFVKIIVNVNVYQITRR